MAFKKIVLAIGASMIVLLLTECGLRVLARVGGNPSMVEDPSLGWDSLPSIKVIGEEIKGAPVLFLGDSFTQNNNWPDQVARSLRLGGIIAGASGFGTYQELLKLQKILPSKKPCMVVLQFYAWNDLRDNWAWPALGYCPEMLARPYLSPEGKEFRPEQFSKMENEFRITSYFTKRSLVRAWQRANKAINSEGIDSIALSRKQLVTGLCTTAAWEPFYLADREDSPYVFGAWKVSEACILEIHRTCRERQIPLLVLALDAPFTVDKDKWLYLSSRQPQLDRNLPMQRLRRFLAKQNIPAVFPQEELRAWNLITGKSVYDGEAESLIGHMTLEGQVVLAKIVANALKGLKSTSKGTQ